MNVRNGEDHIRGRMKSKARKFFPMQLILAGMLLTSGLDGCKSPQLAQQESAPTRFALTGRIVSIDKDKKQVEVDAADIPGFMSAMDMNYSVKNPSLLEPLSPEDRIKADVVVTSSDIWLENIVVVEKSDQTKSPASKAVQPTSPATDKQK
jgi:Copper binding periplasmic protein CusF